MQEEQRSVTRDEIPDDKFLGDIDINRLEEEAVNQVRWHRRYSRRLAHAKLHLGELKARLKVVEADLFLAIKRDYAQFGLTKEASDKVAELCVVTQTEHKLAQKEYLDAQHNVDILTAAIYTLNHRKSMIDNLVYLHGQGYFATPRTGGQYANGRVNPEDVRKPLRERGEDD